MNMGNNPFKNKKFNVEVPLTSGAVPATVVYSFKVQDWEMYTAKEKNRDGKIQSVMHWKTQLSSNGFFKRYDLRVSYDGDTEFNGEPVSGFSTLGQLLLASMGISPEEAYERLVPETIKIYDFNSKKMAEVAGFKLATDGARITVAGVRTIKNRKAGSDQNYKKLATKAVTWEASVYANDETKLSVKEIVAGEKEGKELDEWIAESDGKDDDLFQEIGTSKMKALAGNPPKKPLVTKMKKNISGL